MEQAWGRRRRGDSCAGNEDLNGSRRSTLMGVLVGVLVVFVEGTGAGGATLQVLRRLVVRECDLFELVVELVDHDQRRACATA